MSSPSATGGAYCDYRSGVSGYGREGLERREGSRGAEESGNANYGSQAVSQSPPSSITHMRPIGRRGGLSESFQQIDNNLSREKYTGHDYYNNNNDTDVTNNIYQDGVGRSNDVNVNAAALAEGDATAGRDKTITHFTANAALPAIYQPNRSASQSPQDHADEEDYAPDSTAHPPLQIRYTPHSRQGSLVSQPRQGSVTGLQIRTDIAQPASSSSRPAAIAVREPELHNAISSYNLDSASTAVSNVSLTPSNNLRKAISAASLNSSLSPNGALGSPYLSAMVDITPLPSPITPGEQSPGPWKRMRGTEHEARNNDRLSAVAGAERDGLSPSTLAGSPPRFQYPTSPASPPKKKKGYGNLLPIAVEAQASAAAALATDSPHDENHIAQPQQKFAQSHGRNRSISDFVPEQLHNTRPRHVTINLSTSPSLSPLPDQQQMHREQYLAAQRGLLNPTSASSSTITNMLDVSKALPSPPPSSKSASSDVGDDDESRISSIHEQLEDANTEYFLVRDTHNPSKKRKWRAIRPLGQGTFSKVVLATSERLPSGTPYTDLHLDPSKLVAVKVVEHGPAGGADEERIEVSLKREVDILKSVSHPCIVQLKAMEYTDDHALLVLTFCPGGDLFELASQRRELLTRSLVQRIFAECVAAVRYLHEMGVVHRDVKLENILVHPRPDFLKSLASPQTYAHPLVSLTDLGLSRRIPPPPASPLLTTRCGSEDYAAPEILLGQPYDGRSTDAWALGVVLYALMEGRLPFDCPPGKPERSRVSHRVARCDWIWTRFGDEDGEWKEDENVDWRGAGEVVEGLLKKVRTGRVSLKEVEGMAWVRGGIQVLGGVLKRVDDGGAES